MAIINPLLTKLTKLVRSRYMAGCCHIRLVLFLLFDWPGLRFGSKNVTKKHRQYSGILTSLLDNNAYIYRRAAWGPECSGTNIPGEKIFCINIKLWNLTWWENETLQSISKSAEQTQKSKNKLHRCESHSPYFIFWSFPNRMGRTIWFFSNLDFRFPHVN